jgi:hypothetical protein
MLKRIFTIGLISVFAACNTGDKPSDSGDKGNTLAAPQPITFSIDSVFPHDTQAYTKAREIMKIHLLEL